jgi:hypothetical protein
MLAEDFDELSTISTVTEACFLFLLALRFFRALSSSLELELSLSELLLELLELLLELEELLDELSLSLLSE